MSGTEIITAIVIPGVLLLMSIIAFFLKRTMSSVDKHGADIAEMEKDKASREELTAVRTDISSIKENYITKEDFFREQGNTDRKLDRIYDILLEMKGGKGNG